MRFTFIPKQKGRKLHTLKVDFTGSREEAYTRAVAMAKIGSKLFDSKDFTVRVDRTDSPARGYEVGPDGHTVNSFDNHHQQA